MGTITSTIGAGRMPGGPGRAPRYTLFLLISTWTLGCAIWALSPLSAQAQLRGRITPNPRGPAAVNPYAAIIQPSEEATTLLRRASEGIERQDWKLAIDSLQRIVELPGEHVLTSDGQVYESARRHAHRRIAALPRPGLEAYRLVHDGEAASLLKRGIETYQPALLQVVVDRFLCTSAGDRAAFTLADWLIDEGRFSEAAGLLQSTFGANGRGGVYPDSQLPGWAVPARLAVCAAALGQRQRADALLSIATTQPGAAASGPESGPDTGGARAAAELRLEAVRAHVAAQPSGSETQQSGAWVCALGNWSRDAQQSVVTPTLTIDEIEDEGWRMKLAPEPRLGIDAAVAYARRNHLLPVQHVVTDGHVLVVRGEEDLQALDIDSFSKRWEAKKRQEEAMTASPDEFSPVPLMNVRSGDSSRSGIDDQMGSDPVVVRTLHDSVSAGISLAPVSADSPAPGMALVIEWVRDPPQLVPANMQRRMIGFPGRDPFTATHANRIVAYSLKDGAFLWKSDASATRQVNIAGSGPAETEFLAPPVFAEDCLVAPCRMNSDLFAVVLDPRTGRLVRQLYLCGTGGGAFDSLAALEPCLADGVIFFPTGRELLVAVETSDWSVRWAVRYAGLRDGRPAQGWVPGPPVAVSDVVLLAPTDADQLLCLDRASGSVRWQAERGDFTHIIAAGDRGVWVGGRGVAMLDLETGRPVWQRETDEMSGRGCLSGDRLYVPTYEGLRVLAARDGREADFPRPLEPQVLGNLLAWEGSLYSVGTFTLNKFPDLETGYQQALVRHREAPAEPSRALRLASLELLLHQPERAIEALAGVPADLKDTNPSQYQSVVHLRVRSMLESVSSGKVQGDEALRLLQEARSIALSPADALASVDELGKHLGRSGRSFEAAMQYLTLVLSPEGDLVVMSDGDQIKEAREGEGVKRWARAVAVHRIVDALKDATAEQVAQFHRRLDAFLAEAAGKRDAAGLLWLAESPALGDAAHRAEVLLGAWAASELRYEQAESYFLRAASKSTEKSTRAEAAARLAALYLEPDELHQPVSATVWLDRLQTEWSDVPLPASVVDPSADISTQPAGEKAATLSGRQVVARLLERMDGAVLQRHRAALAPVALGRPSAPRLTMYQMARPLCFRGDRPEPLADTMMMFVEGNKVEAHAVDNGQVLWPAELKLLGDMAVEQRQPDLQANVASARSDALGRARGVLSGQTMIVNTEYGIHAIGLLTGRRLWSRKFIPPEGPGDEAASDACIWTHDGYIVAVEADRHLEVAYAGQGDRILWQARMGNRKWAAVRARGPYVVAVDAALEVADVFRLEDGRYVGECRFLQDVSPYRRVNVTLFDDVICGPVSLNEVKALELATPGVERWRVEMPAAIAQIFKPTPDVLAVADRTGLLRLIDPSSGRQIMQARVKSCGQGVNDGAIMDGVLYIYGYQERVTEPAQLDQQKFGLAAINFAGGDVLWEIRDLPARTFLSDDLLRASPNAIPLVSFIRPGGGAEQPPVRADGTGSGAGSVELVILDKKTGKPIGERITTPMDKDPGAGRIQSVEVWPGRILVASGSSYLRYPVETPPGGAGLEAREPRLLDKSPAREGGLR